MTREEYENEITSWGDLIDFCQENELYTCDELYCYDSIVDLMHDELRGGGNVLENIYYALRYIEDFDADYFMYDDNGIHSLDYDDFERFKEEAADEYGEFDIEEDDEYDEDDESDETENSTEAIEEDVFLKILNMV